MPRRDPAEQARKLAEKITQQIQRGAGKGVDAARVFLTARIKEELSIPAPRKAIRGAPAGGKKGPILGYRATTRATKGAPPRKLSGRLRSSVFSRMANVLTAVIGVNARGEPSASYPLGFPYGRHHEVRDPAHPSSGQHPYIRVTAQKWMGALQTIIGGGVKISLRKRQ